MTLQQLSDSLTKKQADAKRLLALTAPTAEQAKTANALVTEIAEIQKQMDVLRKFDENKKINLTQDNPDVETKAKGLPVRDNVTVKGARLTYKTRYLKDAEQAYTLGLIFMAGIMEHAPSLQKLNDMGLNTKAMFEGDNNLGGALVPTEISTTIINLVEQYGVAPQYMFNETMSYETKDIVRLKHGLAAYWAAEKAQFTASDETSDRVSLTARKLYVYSAHSVELEDDAIINLGDSIAEEMARQAAFKIDDAAFNGDGTSAYGGIVGVRSALTNLSGTIANIAGLQVATGNQYSEVTLADLTTLEGKLPTYAVNNNTAWYMSRAVYAAIIRRLITSASIGGLTATEIINGLPVDRFLGYPVHITQVMPQVEANSQVCLLLGDLSQAAVYGRRSQVIMARDTSKGFDADLVYLKSTWRLDVVVHSVGNASATAGLRQAGPIVGLITAAA